MEIPKANKYNSIQERKEDKIDFLDENIKVDLSFSEEAIKHLPEISDNDLKTGEEKYRVLLGKINKISGNDFNINFEAIFEADVDEKNLYYEEGVGEVFPNTTNIRKTIQSIKKQYPEYKNLEFIGDIHTHPITKENDYSGDPCSLSEDDIHGMIDEYKSERLSLNKPFIFGIAGRRIGEEETSYAFYRLIKKDSAYKIVRL